MGRFPLKSRMNEYMTAMKPYYAKNTLTVRLSCLKAIDHAYASLREKDRTLEADPTKWGEREVMAIMLDMRARELSHGTQTQRLSILKQLLEFVENGVLGKMKSRQPHAFPKVYAERKGSLSPEDLEIVLDTATGIAGWTGECASFCLSMFAYTGVRKGELLSGHREDLDVQTWTFKVRHPKGEGTYGNQRIVPIPDQLRSECVRYLKAREVELAKRGVLETVPLVFSMKDTTKHLSPSVLDVWVKRVSDKTGVKFSPHGLRRTYGQMLLDKGANIETVSLMLGHASTLTTERHYCRKNEDSARLEVILAMRGQAPNVNSPRLNPATELPGYA